MSTKSTLRYSNEKGKDYHFYEECFDEKSVYLNIKNTTFEAKPFSITIEIPKEIWNEIVDIGKMPISAPTENKRTSGSEASSTQTSAEASDVRNPVFNKVTNRQGRG